jgi:hypothetical protein
MAETFLANVSSFSPAWEPRYQVLVHVAERTLAGEASEGQSELEDGTPIAAETARRIACNASIVRVKESADGRPLDVGRKTRAIPLRLRRALHMRDRGCRFPGCTNRRFIDAHHIVHWAHGGRTSLDNTVELCRRHHRLVHEHGYAIERTAEGGVAFRHPEGWLIAKAPPLPAPAGDSLEVLSTQHRDAGLTLNANTAYPRWDGDPVDYDSAVRVLGRRDLQGPASLI